jgi:ABC-2 type transport system ATP-binding protein
MGREATDVAIRATGLSKNYGTTHAVRGLDLEIRTGEFFGLLGPNGSGKTTTVQMLTTLVRPGGGRAEVAGHDVVVDGVAVRRQIGLVFEETALDPTLTVMETLRFAGMLRDLSSVVIRERSDELLDLFGLGEKKQHRVRTLSSGMRRALDIARGVLHRPRILFLDEPTRGLDVINRRNIWGFINRLRREEGLTVFLTTHYLEEAEDCDRIAFLAGGKTVGEGTPRSMIENLGQQMLEIEGDDLETVIATLGDRLGPCLREDRKATFIVKGEFDLASLNAELLGAKLGDHIEGVRQRRPNLNDVFVWVNRTQDTGASR